MLRKDDAPLFLNDTSAFDFSDEVGDEGLSRFNKLRVVVADDGSEAPERPANGAHSALQADDDSLLDQDLPLTNSQLSLKADPCDNCSKRRELLKQRKVKTRLTIAAVLYLLFMIGELVGELCCQLTFHLPCLLLWGLNLLFRKLVIYRDTDLVMCRGLTNCRSA